MYFTSQLLRMTTGAGYYLDLETHNEFNIFDYSLNYSINNSVSIISSGEYYPEESRTQLGLALYY